ncbi:lipopolysaccharide kinase InaA family protein [Methylophaga thiooxydans]|uniref:lipopolysaccharide kinase InaA family protein n=1 Tax=Methylophaga thiooxydans TaxID=392484 RepID=UPI0002F23F31|nr:lipopolysaccharide kinase InaA family protein [Methylophaga thiooxydans]
MQTPTEFKLPIPASPENFDFFWNLDCDWFEPPNYRRGGWSGVIQYQLPVAGKLSDVFIKRQENHITRNRSHCIKGTPTFQREYNNIQQLRQHQIPTLEPIFFAAYQTKAILITKSLTGYQSLEDLSPEHLSLQERHSLIIEIAKLIQQLHSHHFQHNCLYPKHIFIRQQTDQWEAKLIDLEKLRKRLFKKQAMTRDFSTLSRHLADAWSTADRMRFFKAYLGETKLSEKSKRTWRQLTKKMLQKRR